MSAFREAIGHRAGNAVAILAIGAAAIGSAIEFGPGLIEGALHDVFGGAHVSLPHVHVGLTAHPDVTIQMKQTLDNFQFDKYTPLDSANATGGSRADLSHHYNGWKNWGGIGNKIVRGMHFTHAGIASSETITINMPRSAVLGRKSYKLPGSTATHPEYGDVFLVNGDALYSTRSNPDIPKTTSKMPADVAQSMSKVMPTMAKEIKVGKPEVYCYKGLGERLSDVFASNDACGPITAELGVTNQQYLQANCDSQLVASTVKRGSETTTIDIASPSIEAALSSQLRLAGNNPKAYNLTPAQAKTAAQLGAMPISKLPVKVQLVHANLTPMTAAQIKLPRPVGMAARPVAKFANDNGYKRVDVTFTQSKTGCQLTPSSITRVEAASATYKQEVAGK